jgi:NitT/TauT family transport system ATP-binding protein
MDSAHSYSPSSAGIIVSMEGINKAFASGTSALSDFALTLHQGEFLSVLGPSGCGKSTALRLLAGLEHPTKGRIDWSDQDAKTSLSYVFQEPTLMPWTSVWNNVFLPLRIKGIALAQAQARITEALELVGLNGFEKALPRELSGGMRMRASIARAIVMRPKILLMDEPFAALDEITRLKLNNDLLTLVHQLATTVVFVTHSVYESVYLSSRIAIMSPRPGRIIQDIHINPSTPRNDEFRVSADYLTLCQHTSHALQDIMNRASEGVNS